MQDLQLKIVSPEKVYFNGKTSAVKLPGTEGGFSILPGHAPFISSLKEGQIVYHIAEQESARTIDIKGGFVEINNNQVTACIE